MNLRLFGKEALTKVQVAIVAIIIVVAAVGAYYLTLPSPTPSPTPKPTPTPTAPPSPTPTPTPTIPRGGTLRVAFAADIDSLNPLVAVGTETWIWLYTVYDPLVAYDASLNKIPWLLTDWKVSEDGKTWTWHLREGVKWHDGEPLTSKDIKFTLEYFRDYELYTFGTEVKYVTDVETPDDTTIIVHLEMPRMTMPTSLPIFPKHIWQNIDDPLTYANENPIGSGPFKLVEWVKGSHIKMKANEDHWNRPYIDELIIKIYPNMETAILALVNNEVDIVREVPIDAVPKLLEIPDIAVQTSPGLLEHVISLWVDPRTTPAPLRDKRFRVAFAHALDIETIDSLVYAGYIEPGASFVPKLDARWHNPNVKHYEYDPEKSKQILEEAGYIDRDGDGVRESPDGTKLELNLMTYTAYPMHIRVAELVVDYAAKVGIKLDLQLLEPTTLYWYQGPPAQPGAHIFVDDWTCGPPPGLEFISTLFLTEQIVEGGWNGQGYSNPEFDQAYNDWMTSTDPEKRLEAAYKMQEIINEDAVFIVIGYPLRICAYRTDTFVGYTAIDGLISPINLFNFITCHPVATK